MKFAQMVCAASRNVGDEVQSIAAASSLPNVDLYVDREGLNAVEGPGPTCLIMNAWFMHSHNWPPTPFLRPIFVGFHVTPAKQALVAQHAQYLKRYEPIGTRDQGTAEFLGSLGIQTEVTYCMSLTFPSRAKPPTNGKVIIVDANKIEIPGTLRRNAVRLSHLCFFLGMRDAFKLQYARELIEFYRDTASLVITTRLHCALPCIAMGIPVVFFGNRKDSRTQVIGDIGGTIYSSRLHARGLPGATIGRALESIDWSPRPLDVSPLKERLLKAVSSRMEAMRDAQ
jgi:Polysaccharide pyruvyl transferase